MKNYIFAVLSVLATLAVSTVQAADDKCYVLALSAGDESAAYQAGVLKSLTASNSSEYQYDAVSGISGGAVNAALFASYPKGQEVEASARVEQFWLDASQSSLYKNWFGGIIQGLTLEGGLYNSAPLKDFLTEQMQDITSMEREVDLGIVDVLDGLYKDFSRTNLTTDGNLVDALYASLSVAGFFPPVQAFDSEWFDGSAVWDIDIFSAVNRCRDKGFTEADIVIDVILTSAANLAEVDAENYKSINMLFRYLEISNYYNAMDGLLRAQFAYQKATFRHIIMPTESFPTSREPFNIGQKDMEAVIAVGEKDGNTSLQDPAKLSQVMQYFSMKKGGDERLFPHTYGSYLQAHNEGEFGDYDMFNDAHTRIYTHKVQEEHKVKFMAL